MVPQLKAIVNQQARLTIQQARQGAEDLYEALDVEEPKMKKARRGKRGGKGKKKVAAPVKAVLFAGETGGGQHIKLSLSRTFVRTRRKQLG